MTRRLFTRLLPALLTLASVAMAEFPSPLERRIESPSMTNPFESSGEGESVARDGNYIVAGATGPEAQCVRVYDATTKTLLFTLRPERDLGARRFGAAVAISGSRVAVGWPGKGDVFIYDLASANPAVPAWEFGSPDSQNEDLGAAVALEGNRLVVGAPPESPNGDDGVVYVYDLSGAQPASAQFALRPSTWALGRQFAMVARVSEARSRFPKM